MRVAVILRWRKRRVVRHKVYWTAQEYSGGYLRRQLRLFKALEFQAHAVLDRRIEPGV
jgi:hypothetical protein